MKYYYLDGTAKLGPYTLKEISSRNLSEKTMVFREDMSNWEPLSNFEELHKNKNEFEIEDKIALDEIKIEKTSSSRLKNTKINNLQKKTITIVSILIAIVLLGLLASYYYNRVTLSEKEARDASNRFFNILMVENSNAGDIEKLYPFFSEIGSRIAMKSICSINNISRRPDGDFDVFAAYQPDENNSYPIYLLIGKAKGSAIIKSSKGINYAYFDKVLEYGKKLGCLNGSEDDAQMGRIISEKKLRTTFNFLVEFKTQSLYDNIKSSSNVHYEYGWISGDVTITNNNDIDLYYGDIDCSIEFYDNSGQITHSSKIYLFNGVKAHSSASGSVYADSQRSARYKIIPTLNTNSLKDRIKDKIIEESSIGCY